MTINPLVTTDRVLQQVLAERIAQDDKWGEQNHPDGTGGPAYEAMAARVRARAEKAAAAGALTWLEVLAEEVAEALAESDPARLRAELLQVAAVAVCWIEAIDRRTMRNADEAGEQQR